MLYNYLIINNHAILLTRKIEKYNCNFFKRLDNISGLLICINFAVWERFEFLYSHLLKI